MNGVNPYKVLVKLFEELPNAKTVEDYEHNHVMRAALLGTFGTAHATGPVAGQRFVSYLGYQMPPETTLETDEPETTPLSADDTTATLAGPPRRWPSVANDTCSM